MTGWEVSVNAQAPMGARSLALGNATTALSQDNWALFSNPAMLQNQRSTLGFYGLRNYGFANLTDMAAAGILKTGLGTTSLGVKRYGDDLFNETNIRLGYKNEWNMLHFGVAVSYNHLAIAQPYGSGGALGVDVGIAAQITNGLWVGAKSANLNKPVYDFQSGSEDLQRDLSVGLSYALEERALLVLDMVKDVRFPVSYRGGVEVLVVEGLTGRAGVTTEPLTYSFGFGYGKSIWEANIAVQHHELLGFSPGLDLFFRF